MDQTAQSMTVQEAENIMRLDCADPDCTEAGRIVLDELRGVRGALRNLLTAVESPQRGIYVDEIALARRALRLPER